MSISRCKASNIASISRKPAKGTPVLMQHTAGSDGRQWRHILEDEKLTSEFRFIAHDLPYHGKSLPPLGKPWWRERYSLSQSFAVEFIEAMTKALGIEKANLRRLLDGRPSRAGPGARADRDFFAL